MTIRLIAAISAAICALLVIFGPSYNTNADGQVIITNLGWGTILGLVVSLAVAITQIIQDGSKQKKLQSLANKHVLKAIQRLLYPFNSALMELPYKNRSYDLDYERLDKVPRYTIELLSDSTVRNDIGITDLRANANVYPKLTWGEFFAESAKKANELLGEAEGKYKNDLETKTILAINDLRDSSFLQIHLSDIETLISINSNIVPYTLNYVIEGHGDYSDFDFFLVKIDNLIDSID